MIRKLLVGGPLLEREFSPLISGPIKSERLVLLTTSRFVVVLSCRTGRKLATLVPDASIRSVCLADNSLSLIVGCHDGKLREFSMEDVLEKPGRTMISGSFDIPGPSFAPRTVYKTNVDKPIRLLCEKSGGSFYAVWETETKDDKVLASLGCLTLHPSKKSNMQPIIIYDKLKYHREDDIPFFLSSHKSQKPSVNLVLVARPHALTIFCDDDSASDHLDRIKISRKHKLTAVAVHAETVALGYQSGEIRVHDNLLMHVDGYRSAMERYRSGTLKDKPKHPNDSVIVRKLHWHAHPVSTVAFHGTQLYSGGDEGVLVTWQLNRGSDKPAAVLPRLALGGIVRVNASDAIEVGVLVYSQDNSLQLFAAHNQSLLWKSQGLATGPGPANVVVQSSPTFSVASQDVVVLSGLPCAPGYIHWFNIKDHNVENSLEVVPFNRISRTEPGDVPLAPAVLHAVWSENRDTLITVDEVPTENSSMGASRAIGKGSEVGIISTIRFWTLQNEGDSKQPYRLLAAMTHPHGFGQNVSAVCVSPDGKFACTVSNDENAFRLWNQVEENDEKTGQRQPAWICQYKVSTPAGYAKYPVRKGSLCFSSDSSILAIAYNDLIALWDHQEVILLTSLRHKGGEGSPIHSLRFVSSNLIRDMILTATAQGVSLQSAYGSMGPLNQGWSFILPQSMHQWTVSCADFVVSPSLVAVAAYNQHVNLSRVFLRNAVTGEAHHTEEDSARVVELPGEVISIVSEVKVAPRSNWNNSKVTDTSVRFFVAMKSGEIVAVLLNGRGGELWPVTSIADDMEASVPKLPLLSTIPDNRKRPKMVVDFAEIGVHPTKKMHLEDFSPGQTETTTEFPSLKGGFIRAFLGRHLHR